MKSKTIIRSVLLVFALGSLAVWGYREYLTMRDTLLWF